MEESGDSIVRLTAADAAVIREAMEAAAGHLKGHHAGRALNQAVVMMKAGQEQMARAAAKAVITAGFGLPTGPVLPGNRPEPELHGEVTRWLLKRPEPELRELGRDMEGQFRVLGRPGKAKGRRWWIGAVAITRAFMLHERQAKVTTERAERRREKAKCYATGKVIFGSESEAKRNRRSGRKKVRLRVYLCPHCHGYHYTSQKRREA